MQNRITNLNIATVNNEDYIRESSSEQLIYFRTQQLADKAKYCENSILKYENNELFLLILMLTS